MLSNCNDLHVHVGEGCESYRHVSCDRLIVGDNLNLARDSFKKGGARTQAFTRHVHVHALVEGFGMLLALNPTPKGGSNLEQLEILSRHVGKKRNA